MQKLAWESLAREWQRSSTQSLQNLFHQNSKRAQEFIYSHAGVTLDISKNPLDKKLIDAFCEFAEKMHLPEAIAKINEQSHHIAQRANPDFLALQKLIDRIESKNFDTIVHLGTGGSYLGPCLLDAALENYSSKKYAIHYVTNLDKAEISEVLAKINPARTLFIMVSKSFSTAEVFQNAEIALRVAPRDQFVAVTAEPKRALDFGISAENILSFDAKLGGRFSLWSAVSLSVILNIGLANYAELLAGAAAMDAHFQSAAFSENMPVLLAFLDFGLTTFSKYHSRCIVPYSHNLRYFPDHLQQLHMESLGKSVDLNNKRLDYLTGGILWGQVATPSQHSFHQYLLQGNHPEAVDFILPLRDKHGELNEVMISNCLSQSELMAIGYQSTEVYKSIPGNKPNTLIMLDSVSPFNLGALIALYEHKIFAMSVLWQINAFDQWGVERGKFLALKPEANLTINQHIYSKIFEGRLKKSKFCTIASV